MKDMYNKGGETADDKRYRMRMQKQVGGVAEEMSDVDKFIQLNAELEAAKQQYKGNPEALKNVARHRADIENSFSPETRAEAYQRMDAETEERDGKMEGGEVDGREGYANAGVTSIVNYFIKSKEGKKIIKDLVKGVNKPLKADARSAKVLTDNYDSVDLQRMAEALATTVQANTKYSADGVASLITNKSNIINCVIRCVFETFIM